MAVLINDNLLLYSFDINQSQEIMKKVIYITFSGKANEADIPTSQKQKDYQVSTLFFKGPESLNFIIEEHPSAIIFNLAKRPSTCRDLAIYIRKRKNLRMIPFLFVEGEEEKIKKIKSLFPEDYFCGKDDLNSIIIKILAEPARLFPQPESLFSGYSGRSALEKLDIRRNENICLINVDESFYSIFEENVESYNFGSRITRETKLTLIYLQEEKNVAPFLRYFLDNSRDDSSLWLCWPKKKDKIKTTLSQKFIRDTALGFGLVDYKICSIDNNWSAMKFTRKKR